MKARDKRRQQLRQAVRVASEIAQWIFVGQHSLAAAAGGPIAPGLSLVLLANGRVRRRLQAPLPALVQFALTDADAAHCWSSPERLQDLVVRTGARLAGSAVTSFVTTSQIQAFVALVGEDIWRLALSCAPRGPSNPAHTILTPDEAAAQFIAAGEHAVMLYARQLAPVLADVLAPAEEIGQPHQSGIGTPDTDTAMAAVRCAVKEVP